MELIERKIKSGQTEAIEEIEEAPEEEEGPPSINFMEVLKESVAHAKKPKRPSTRRSAKRKAAPRRKAAKKRQAG